MDAEAIRMLAAGLAMGLGAIGPGIGIGILGYGAMQALGRNPEARGPIMTNMILAIAFAEAIGINTFVTSKLTYSRACLNKKRSVDYARRRDSNDSAYHGFDRHNHRYSGRLFRYYLGIPASIA